MRVRSACPVGRAAISSARSSSIRSGFAASAALAFACGLFAFLRYTRTGIAIRACADNGLGAAVAGLNVERLYAVTFGVGLACVGAAGALLATTADAAPDLASTYTL